MITSNDELAVVRQQAARVEEIILGLGLQARLKVDPSWPLYVGRWVEMLRKLRSEIDEYLGIANFVTDDGTGARAAAEPGVQRELAGNSAA